ncbi:MAG: hypothetical protein ABEK50_11010 [bacterium]
MQGLQLPLIPLGSEESGEFLLFLPAVRTDELLEVGFEVNEEENLLQVACIYDEDEEGNPVGNSYPIEINENNQRQIDQLEKLVVLHPDDQDVEELSDDPQIQDDLEELFTHIRQLENELSQEEV